jgi:hypothetical protein
MNLYLQFVFQNQFVHQLIVLIHHKLEVLIDDVLYAMLQFQYFHFDDDYYYLLDLLVYIEKQHFHLVVYVDELNLLFQEFYHRFHLILFEYYQVYVDFQHDQELNVLN